MRLRSRYHPGNLARFDCLGHLPEVRTFVDLDDPVEKSGADGMFRAELVGNCLTDTVPVAHESFALCAPDYLACEVRFGLTDRIDLYCCSSDCAADRTRHGVVRRLLRLKDGDASSGGARTRREVASSAGRGSELGPENAVEREGSLGSAAVHGAS